MKKYIILADSNFLASNVSSFDPESTCTQIISGCEENPSVWLIKTRLMASQVVLIRGVLRLGMLHD